jgi:hypothetical protein
MICLLSGRDGLGRIRIGWVVHSCVYIGCEIVLKNDEVF